MRYFELKVTVFLKKDMSVNDIYHNVSKYIFECFNDKDKLSKWHFENRYKYYVFDRLYNKDIDIRKYGFTYPKANSYSFRIRSIDKKLIDTLERRFTEVKNNYFTFIEAKQRFQKQFFIQKLICKTPVISSTSDSINWSIKDDGDILKLQRLLHDNLEKKYKNFYGDIKPQINFIQLLEIKNKTPHKIVIKKDEKEITFLGNIFEIIPNEDETSQKLAFLALGAGLGERNSYGSGFLVAR